MSGLHAQSKENTRQVIADLDDLFTEYGIAISGDVDTLTLTAGSHHGLEHQRQGLLSTPPKNALKGAPQLRFEGAEHTAIGDSTLLRFVKDAPAIPASQVELHLPNGLALTYGQVIALGVIFMEFPTNRSAKAQQRRTESSALPTPSTPWRYCRPQTPRRS